MILPLAPDRCGLRESARIATYLAGQSAGRCGPCRFGLPHLARLLDRVARCERDPVPVGEVKRWTGLVARRGAGHRHLAGHCVEDR